MYIVQTYLYCTKHLTVDCLYGLEQQCVQEHGRAGHNLMKTSMSRSPGQGLNDLCTLWNLVSCVFCSPDSEPDARLGLLTILKTENRNTDRNTHRHTGVSKKSARTKNKQTQHQLTCWFNPFQTEPLNICKYIVKNIISCKIQRDYLRCSIVLMVFLLILTQEPKAIQIFVVCY